MAETHSRAPGSAEPPADDRLESWKEIAAYLKRGVRTVQRWERQGLPVHRLHHESRDTVHAFRSELDAWWRNGRDRIEGSSLGIPAAGRRRIVLGVAAVLTAAVAVGWWAWRPQTELPFEERDWVLLASFENRTPDESMGRDLEQALAAELAGSKRVRVVPRPQIEEALALMRRPPSTALEASAAREICLREGDIRGLITGRIDESEGAYVMSVTLVDPQRGVAVSQVTEEAAAAKPRAAAIRRLARRFADSLSTELARLQLPSRKLQRVTSRSLRALEDFTTGLNFLAHAEVPQAIDLLQQAVQADADFASAHIFLAYALSRRGERRAAAPHFERAFQLAETASPRERHFILGTYYELYQKDDERAAKEYEIILSTHPGDWWTLDSLQWLRLRRGEHEKVVPHLLRYSDLHPHDFGANVVAAMALGIWNNDHARARPYLERARRLLPTARDSAAPFASLWVELHPVYEYWSADRIDPALMELDRLAQTLRPAPGLSDNPLVEYMAPAYLTFGQLQKVEELYARLAVDNPRRRRGLALVAFARGDQEAFHQAIQLYPQVWRSSHGRVLLARHGFLAEAEQGLDSSLPGVQEIVRAEKLLAGGNAEGSIPLFEQGMARLSPWSRAAFFLAAEGLAQAWQDKGDLAEAIRVLETATRQRERAATAGQWAAWHWLQAEARLAGLYRKIGRVRDGEQTEQKLRRLLARADSDCLLARQLAQTKVADMRQEPATRQVGLPATTK